MADTITLKELLAITVRRAKVLIAVALVFAIPVGALCADRNIDKMYSADNTVEAIEEKYQADLDVYQKQEQILSEQLLNLERSLESQQDHLSTSVLMQLDPSNKASTVINVAIAELAQSDFDKVYSIEGTSADYIISRIQNQYLVLWEGLNLETIFGSNLTDRQWRELVVLQEKNGGVIEISVSAKTIEESAAMAEKAYAYLTGNTETIIRSAYSHTLVLLSRSSKMAADPDLEQTQKDALATIEQCKTQIRTLENELNALKEPARTEQITVATIIRDTAMYALLGGILGGIVTVVCIIVGYLFGTKLVFSDYLVQNLKIPMLVSFSAKGDLFGRLADRILGERVWNGEESALAYLSKSAAARLEPGAKVALLSSLRFKKQENFVQSVKATLENMGYSVCFVDDAVYNAEMLPAIADNDCVILLERRNVSRIKSVELLISLSGEQEKPVKGFILV